MANSWQAVPIAEQNVEQPVAMLEQNVPAALQGFVVHAGVEQQQEDKFA